MFNRVICLFSDKTGFIFHQQLYQPITSEFTMKLSGQGKLELGLVKNVAARWQTLGTPQSDHNWFGFVKVTIYFAQFSKRVLKRYLLI